MTMLVADPFVERDLIAERKAKGLDRYDEVWEGMYVIMPSPDNEHQDLILELSVIGVAAIKRPGLGDALPGCNVSDRDEDWRENYREPDFAIFLKGTQARNRGTYWLGGPDFGVEIRSPNDRTYEKFDFYAQVGTGELLVIGRNPWKLELYRRADGEMRLVGQSTLDQPDVLHSEVIPLSFRLVPGEVRPRIEVVHRENGQRWEV
jgi:Uma2 family endonuclease